MKFNVPGKLVVPRINRNNEVENTGYMLNELMKAKVNRLRLSVRSLIYIYNSLTTGSYYSCISGWDHYVISRPLMVMVVILDVFMITLQYSINYIRSNPSVPLGCW